MGKAEDARTEYKYDAFISYRHSDLDGYVAEKLHKMLESYKLPRNVKRRLKRQNAEAKTRITRVFRDEEELPLSSDLENSIINALQSSEWLIVVCSPRLKESVWCRREIETFIEMHGKERVLAVLIDGEPKDSFPEELLYKDVEVTKPDGTKELLRKTVEPLAADVRGKSRFSVKKNLESELIRLCAPMFNLKYDELKQRHREHKLKRLVVLASIVAVTSLVLFLTSFSVALKIKAQSFEIEQKNETLEQQKEQIEKQNDQIRYAQAKQLAASSLDYLAHDDKLAALQSAYSAVTSYGGIEMPYTDEARYALTQSVNPYSLLEDYESEAIIGANGKIVDMKLSADESILMIHDDSNCFSFWSVEDKQKIGETYYTGPLIYNNNLYTFVDNRYFAFTQDEDLYIYDIHGDELRCLYDAEPYESLEYVKWDAQNHRIAVAVYKSILLFDDSDFSLVLQSEIENIPIINNIQILKDGSYALFSHSGGGVICDSQLNEICQIAQWPKNEDVECLLEYEDLIYILCSDRMETSDTSTIYAYNHNGKLKWKWETDKYIFNLGAVVYAGGNEGNTLSLIAVGENMLALLNLETGEEQYTETLAEKMVWSGLIGGTIYLVSDKAEMSRMGRGKVVSAQNNINTCLTSVKFVKVCENGIFLVAPESTEAIFYEVHSVEYNEDVGETFTERTEFDLIKDKDDIAALGFPEPKMIKSVIFDDNHEKACAVRKDGKAVIYNLSDKTELTSFDVSSKSEINGYLGKDNEGNDYWSSPFVGYCISPDNCLIAKIDYLRGIDNDRNEYVIGNVIVNANRYSVRICSFDEIKAMAEEKLEKYGN